MLVVGVKETMQMTAFNYLLKTSYVVSDLFYFFLFFISQVLGSLTMQSLLELLLDIILI